MEVIIPGKVKTAEPDWTGVSLDYKHKVSAVCRSLADCQDLVAWFDGRPDFCPFQPILLLLPGLQTPGLICGMGFATAAELRDTAVAYWGSKSVLIAKKGGIFDWDDIRERSGQMPREKVPEAVAYAFWDRVARHKASPRTDPVKQFRYYRPTNPTVFVVNGMRDK